VADARQDDELGRVAGGDGRLVVRAAHRHRDDRVVLAVHEQLRNAERQQLRGRGVGEELLAAADELERRAVGEAEPCGLGEVADAGLRDRVRDEPLRGGPERELTARRVADRDARLAGRGGLDLRPDVVEGRRPAAARAEPPVLDVRDRPAAAVEVGGEVVHEHPIVGVAPEAAVDQDGNAQTSSSVRAASCRSRSVMPPAEWVDHRNVTRL
jgi:hypothetical protein